MTDEYGRDPDDVGAEEMIAARGHVESHLAELGIDLSDPALWLEPAPAADGRLRTPHAASPAQLRSPPWRRWLVVAAAVVVILAGTALVLRPDSPDWTLALGPTSDYPQASATIDGWNEGSGTRMVLDMSGVDPAPAGFFYEMWMSEGPIHISAGTFVETQGVELRAAVARRDYPRLWVTLEPIDDDESPTSTVVIDTGR